MKLLKSFLMFCNQPVSVCMKQAADAGKKFIAGAVTVGAGAVASVKSEVAMAQTTISTTEVTAFLEDQVVVAIAAIGAVFLLVAVVFAGYRWARGAASGS